MDGGRQHTTDREVHMPESDPGSPSTHEDADVVAIGAGTDEGRHLVKHPLLHVAVGGGWGGEGGILPD